MSGQGRAGQGRAGQGRAGQGRAGQGRARRGEAGRRVGAGRGNSSYLKEKLGSGYEVICFAISKLTGLKEKTIDTTTAT